ncbi:CHAT domain-containing protein [Mycena venus]|uniref:CHAT domain-containing protein n=1 Tax=Mycena venus TaxID=2733690 RepID=A0A8H7CXY3_9AGAR|nr:CHAT domain-containing protein [Mycena venus]
MSLREHRVMSEDLDKEIIYQRDALSLCEPSHPNRSSSLNNLAVAIWKRYRQQRQTRDINEAIELHREALALRQSPHPDRSSSLNNLAIAFITRFEQQGDTRDIDEAIELLGQAMALGTIPHPDRDRSLNNLANAFFTRFGQLGYASDIETAILLHREALALRDPPHPERGRSLNNLASVICTRFRQRGETGDIDEAIELHREALALYGQSHPSRGHSLNNLATAVLTRFEHQGSTKDVEEAIELYEEALILCIPSHPNRSRTLNNLADAVFTRFRQQGETKDINRAIELHRQALTLCAPPHADRGMVLSNLAVVLFTRFGEQGDTQDIDEAIDLHREALSLREAPHPDRSGFLNNLANAILTRFELQGDTRDINEAIKLHSEALALREPPHSDRSGSLNNLAAALYTRFQQFEDSKDLNLAIELSRESLSLRELPHPDRGTSLNNLATAVRIRFDQQGDIEDIDEAIELHREALVLQVPPHPGHARRLNNLATALLTRLEKQRDTRDLEEAIELYRKTLIFCAPPHPYRGSSLHSLAMCLVITYKVTRDNRDLERACELFQEAVAYSSSSPSTRFHHAWSWAHYMAEDCPTSSLTAYHAAIELLPQLAALDLDLPSRQRVFSNLTKTSLPSEAAACAVGLCQYNTAVELLEASRSIFWSQAINLRTPLDDLATIHSDLSTQLKCLAKELERASFRDTSRDISTDGQHRIRSIESEGARCREINKKWEQTIKEVQSLPGFGHFMRPKSIAALQQAAESGPIVFLTTTDFACFALIVTLSIDVQYVKLPEVLLPEVRVLAELSRGLSNQAFDFDTFIKTRRPGSHLPNGSQLEARLCAGREGTVKLDQNEVFRALLAEIWNGVAKPVLKVLKLQKSVHPPRLWWCPTGPFGLLPLHAAGIYAKDKTECVSDYVVSSYTPTLTALLDPPSATATPFKMTAVIQPQVPDCSPLPGARKELAQIADKVPNQWLTQLVEPTVGTALSHLRESSIVHVACHGVQDLNQPLDSGLILADGHLKVVDIMRQRDSLNLNKSMSLAFLSACETAKADKVMPDESIHLAATMIFAGFRGVVATMWTMDDRDGPKIASTFYEHLLKSCDPNSNPPILPDLKQAAKALHLAVAQLREEPDIPFRRWVPFVHYGL